VNVNFKDDGSKNMAWLAEMEKRHAFSFLKMCFSEISLLQNYNFACDSVWVWNLVSDIKGGT
jgi:hypothetical protein